MSPGSVIDIVIEPQGWHFEAQCGLSLVESARAAGIVMPTSCRNGTCRACLCRLASGTVRYRIEWPGLSAEEKAEGWVLPCVALAAVDVVIDAPFAQASSTTP